MDAGTRGLAERVLAVLDEGAVSTTYKYAVLLSLIDAALEGSGPSGDPPEQIEVQTLAGHVLAMYWPHTDLYPGTGEVLRQSGSGQAELISDIQRFRSAEPGLRRTAAAARHTAGYGGLLATATWKLAEMPLPRLQRLGTSVDPFLYDLGWDETIRRSEFEHDGFDRSIRLQPGAGAELVRLAPLIRPLVERLWAARVIVYNRLPDGALDQFLFRRARLDAVRLRLALYELQDGRCFYTGRPLRVTEADVDHFVPWSRSPVNAVENLVVAGRRANNSKRDHLAAAELVQRWREHIRRGAADLAEVAGSNRWETAPGPTLGVARSLYFALSPSNLLWTPSGVFVPADLPLLREVLAA